MDKRHPETIINATEEMVCAFRHKAWGFWFKFKITGRGGRSWRILIKQAIFSTNYATDGCRKQREKQLTPILTH